MISEREKTTTPVPAFVPPSFWFYSGLLGYVSSERNPANVIAVLNQPGNRKLIDSVERVIEMIKAAPVCSDLLNYDSIMKLFEDCNDRNFVELIKKDPKILENEGIRGLISLKSTRVVWIMRAIPSKIPFLLSDARILGSVEYGCQVVEIIQAAPESAPILLNDARIRDLINLTFFFYAIIRAAPANATFLLSEAHVRDLIDNDDRLIPKIIKVAPASVPLLLGDARIRNLIDDDDQLLDIIKAAPESVPLLLSDARIRGLIKYYSKLLLIIQAAPESATLLLSDARIRNWIEDDSSLYTILLAAPASALLLLSDTRIRGLIEDSRQMMDIIRVAPACAVACLLNDSRTLDLIVKNEQCFVEMVNKVKPWVDQLCEENRLHELSSEAAFIFAELYAGYNESLKDFPVDVEKTYQLYARVGANSPHFNEARLRMGEILAGHGEPQKAIQVLLQSRDPQAKTLRNGLLSSLAEDGGYRRNPPIARRLLHWIQFFGSCDKDDSGEIQFRYGSDRKDASSSSASASTSTVTPS